jgi:TfoX/Sxy family transcriptional regulator of competence genes
MASKQISVNYILEQLSQISGIYARKMFGEYAIYCDGKLVALICDDQLFIKPTKSGKAYLGKVVEASPYRGAKPYFLISGERWDDAEWLSELIKISAIELPKRNSKKKK